MVFDNGKTSFKKAGFPDASALTLFDIPDHSIHAEKVEIAHT